MDGNVENVRRHYDQNPQLEWERLENHPFELVLTTWMMEKYIKPGERILDIGGGPGRYSIHFAKQGADVTLVDLSPGNVSLAREKALEAGVNIRAFAANCLELDQLQLGEYDHVFLMGPLYHLLKETDRIRAVEIALSHLKPGGLFYASFILAFSGIIFDLRNGGLIERDLANPACATLVENLISGENYTGPAFTDACFYHQDQILPFMQRFPLQKLHLFGQEGILAISETNLLSRSESEVQCWIELAKRLLERPELLSHSEHAMYIGQKQ